MLKITKETDYALLLLVDIARAQARDERPLNAAKLAEQSCIPQAMVSKTLKSLTQADLLHSVRGPLGGYLLARQAGQITMKAVIEALEGPIALTECLTDETGCCSRQQQAGSVECSTNRYWRHVNSVICQTLSGINLAMLMDETQIAEFPLFPGMQIPEHKTHTG